MGGIVGTCSGYDGDSAFGRFNREADRLQMLGIIKCGGFAAGAADDQGVRAVFDLVFDQSLQGIIIDFFVFLHRCHKSSSGTFKYSHVLPPFI